MAIARRGSNVKVMGQAMWSVRPRSRAVFLLFLTFRRHLSCSVYTLVSAHSYFLRSATQHSCRERYSYIGAGADASVAADDDADRVIIAQYLYMAP